MWLSSSKAQPFVTEDRREGLPSRGFPVYRWVKGQPIILAASNEFSFTLNINVKRVFCEGVFYKWWTMTAKKRYLLLLLCFLVAFLVALEGLKPSKNRFVLWKASRPRVVLEDIFGRHPFNQEVKSPETATTCRMETCFNLTR